MTNQDKFTGLNRYTQKVFRLGDLISEYDQLRPYKQINDAKVMFGITSGLGAGLTSLNELAVHSGVTRGVLEDFLNLEGLNSRLRKFIKAMIKRMKRGKMIELENVQGKYLAAVDGVETFRRRYTAEKFFEAILNGRIDHQCQVSVHRDAKTNQIVAYETYHRIVIICMISKRGPFPVAWGYQQSDGCNVYQKWLLKGSKPEEHPAVDGSAEKSKQTGELTVFKSLLTELRESNSHKLPFDIIVGDGLYDKAPILEAVEGFGAVLIAVQKDERRSLRQQAENDFSTRPSDKTWDEIRRQFEGWSGIFIDQHLNKQDKTVKIVRVIRRTADGIAIDNYFYCSNKSWITPRLVEWCRHYRWREENGFNSWTNEWKLLKHVFHHSSAACDAMIGFIFITIISVVNYQLGNLRRGGREFKQTLKDFFRDVMSGLRSSGKSLREFFKTFYYQEASD
jgi:hypothetical protein